MIVTSFAGEINSSLLDLYLPEEKKEGVLLIYFHGGGLESGDKTDEREIYMQLAASGIAVVSANYRLYPGARFPEYVQDAAKAVAWSLKLKEKDAFYRSVYIGGISAGAYLSMMLHFQPHYLEKYGVKEEEISGYIFDAGQPTIHYNIFRERGADPLSIRVDEAAPVYFVDDRHISFGRQRFLILVADRDIPGRREQNELLIRAMENHQYSPEQIDYCVIRGYEHVGYVHEKNENGQYPYVDWLLDFIRQRG